MAPLRSTALFMAVSAGTFCSAFVAPGPMPRHTAPSTATTALSSRSIVLRSKGSPSSSSSSSSRAISKATVGGGAAPSVFRAAKQEQERQPAGALEAVPSSGGGEGGGGGCAVPSSGGGEEMEREGGDLTGLRRSLLFGVWLPFVAYAFGPWSPGQPGDPKDIELVTHLYDTFGPETAVFSSIFNALGFLPAMMGRQPVPPQPFVFGAFALGFFALGPYLALRNYLPEVDSEGDEVSTLEKLVTSKVSAVLFLALSSYCVVSFFSAVADPAAVTSYVDLFWSSKLAHISTLDAVVLSAAAVDPLREDMVRRGWEPEAAKVALFAVPLVGLALWLLVRPAVVKE
eukprot:jgi/Undpi1/29/HiC_scaffold_1.g00029.m1